VRAGRVDVLLMLGGLVACAGRRESTAGELSFEWSSTDTTVGVGRWSGGAEAAWCESRQRLAVFGARGDTGAALLVLLPALEPASGIPLVTAADSGLAPRATVAARWSSERAVMALRSDSGSLTLTQVAPTLSGRFDGTLSRPDSEFAAPTIRGQLRDVAVVAGDAACRRLGVGQTPDSGVP
jgi:hypothetical protein